ncbi:MAG TPA: hypothetical protein VGG77_04150 [Roseiarcus sp.]
MDGAPTQAFDAVRAIASASLAAPTGADVQPKHKETSLGGLAVNFVEC